MKKNLIVFALALLAALSLAPVQAGQINVSKKTSVTISHPLEIPGQTLPPGSYIFKVMDVTGSRNIVQVLNQDETQAIATLIAVPNYRLEQTGQPVLEFHERAGNAPHALRAWFYAREKSGLEFVYPKPEALKLAEASNEIVPAEVEELSASNLHTVALIAITPSDKEESLEQAIQTTSEPVEVAQNAQLPRTASSFPLIALLGVSFLGAALGLNRISARVHQS